jgi:hypothetical protein
VQLHSQRHKAPDSQKISAIQLRSLLPLAFDCRTDRCKFFVSEETTELFRYGACGAILAESLIAVIHRVYELLSGKSTKIWHKVLLVICIVLILLLVLIK